MPIVLIWDRFQANDPAFDLYTLTHRTRRAALSVQRRPDLLRAFFRHAGLSLRLQ
jgi:hypothetical protein